MVDQILLKTKEQCMSVSLTSNASPASALFIPGTRVAFSLQALESNVLAIGSICNLLKTSFGPNALSKMLIDPSGGILITNDGARIVRQMMLSSPASKIFIEIAQAQEVGLYNYNCCFRLFFLFLLQSW